MRFPEIKFAGRQIFQFLLGLILSIVFLYLALKGTDWEMVLHYLKKVRIWNLLISLFSLLIHFYIRTIRWKFINGKIGTVTFRTSFTSIMLGYFFNNLLPFRIGEIVKVSVVTGKSKKISFTSGLAALIVERGMDIFTLLLIFTLILPWIKISQTIKEKMIFALYIVIGIFIVLVFLSRKISTDVSEENGGIPAGKLKLFAHGLKSISTFKDFMIVILLSLLLWPFSALYYYFLLIGVGINLPYVVSLLLPIIVGMGIILPSAPGYIGTYEYFILLVLNVYHIEHNQALAAALVIHFWQYLIILIIGIILLMKESLTFRSRS